MKRLLLLVTFIGMLLMALGGYALSRQMQFLRNAETATATVTTYSVRKSGGDETYCPILVFTRSDGLTVVYYGQVCASPPPFEIGQQVEVLYDPLEDRGAQLNDFWSKYRDVLVPFGVGLPLFLVGLFGLRLLGRRSNAGRQG
jgi:hypothetical protein